VLERWRQSGSGMLRSDGRPLWLIPLSGKGEIDGGPFEAGGVWLAEGETALALGEGADMLVAYPKSGVIEGVWG